VDDSAQRATGAAHAVASHRWRSVSCQDQPPGLTSIGTQPLRSASGTHAAALTCPLGKPSASIPAATGAQSHAASANKYVYCLRRIVVSTGLALPLSTYSRSVSASVTSVPRTSISAEPRGAGACGDEPGPGGGAPAGPASRARFWAANSSGTAPIC